MTADLKDWIAVAALPDLGAASVKKLWDQGWTPEKLLCSSEADWHRLNLKQKTITALSDIQQGRASPALQKLDSALAWQASAEDCHILAITDADYPALLREIYDPPPILFARGNLTALNLPQVGIVGSRSASSGGVKHAYQFAGYLAQNGLIVNSGLALGIDAAAHQASVNAQCPTVAVFGTGLDRPYPARNRILAQQILEQQGVWLSELFPGAPPLAPHFPRRNRIISGMSAGILVVEAAPKSGSLITARMAMEHGREVFAIPGSINNPLSKGCHQLIREGACLVESAEDITSQLAPMLGYLAEQNAEHIEGDSEKDVSHFAPETQRLLKHLGYEYNSIDQLSYLTGMDIAELGPILVELELLGIISQDGHGYIRC
ncbi:DNA-processing protein DprA [Neptuniibacter sp. QD72_48]|uniref:DNA-processing protein DprA n=1 Tax=unclassified Neptuniibacter TaxID=2630693 RepID=UPI0039F72F8A